ncbi:MAG: DNA translocase FtsK [Oscillospiraceae bacterium]|nr:DNA translocase FtsK [Oscillospiraceae bacterium]
MAAKTTSKTTTRKTGAAPKKRGRPSAKETAQAKKKAEAEARSRRQLWAVILFAAGLFFFFVTLIPGDGGWEWLHTAFYGLFGWCSFLIAPAFIYIAVMAAMDKPMGSVGHKVWQSFALITLICGATQIFSSAAFEAEDFVDGVKQLYKLGTQLKGGGLAAGIVGVPLLSFGKTGAAVTIILLIFIFVMILTGATLLDLIRGASRPVKRMEQAYIERVEEKNQPPRFNIDVPLTEESAPAAEEPAAASPRQNEAAEAARLAREKLLETAAGARVPAEKKEESRRTEPQIDDILQRMKEEKQPSLPDPVPEPTPAPELSDEETPEEDGSLEGELAEAFAGEESEEAPPENDLQEMEPAESYIYPPSYLLREVERRQDEDMDEEFKANAQLLTDTLASFGVQARIIDISRGPSVTRYELQPSAGVKISKITNLADDIALNLAASGVRIEAPIPNKAAVGIEVPNKITSMVQIREIIDSPEFKNAQSRVTMCLGRDIAGKVCVADISKMPHMLIAGATGSGKSVCINSIIMSILYKATPDEVRLLMVDPKVVELGVYNGIPHLLVPVVTDPRKAAGALNWAVSEMLGRYKKFADNGVRDIRGYNELAQEQPERGLARLPQVVIIIDELADLMIAAQNEVEDAICRLAQMARAAGMHLVIATQRPSVDVITGVIKANIPSRIAFAVSSQVDSRTILDAGGAEKLLGKGDMLFLPMGQSKPVRIQGCFVSDKEVEKVTAFIKGTAKAEYDDEILQEIERQAAQEKGSGKGQDGGGFDDQDDLLPAAIECVVELGQASTSLLQRKFKLGYSRAARLVDAMEERGIVGPFEGSRPRQVLITRQQWLEMKMRQDSEGVPEEI